MSGNKTVATSPEMREKDLDTMRRMKRWGGSFVKALATAAELADDDNLKRIKEAFPEYWSRYEDERFQA
jgi:hypothetical protein